MNEGYTFTDLDDEVHDKRRSYDEPEEKIDDEDILSEIEGRVDDLDDDDYEEKRLKRQRRVKKGKKAKGKGRRARTNALGFVALVAVIFGAEFFAMNYLKIGDKLNMKAPKQVKALVGDETTEPNYETLGTDYSSKNIEAKTDSNVAEYYRFLLLGDHKAAGDNGVVSFNFGSDDEYSGYSSAGEETNGTYRIYTDNGEYLVTTTCGEAVDTYTLGFSEENDIILTNGSAMYSLYE